MSNNEQESTMEEMEAEDSLIDFLRYTNDDDDVYSHYNFIMSTTRKTYEDNLRCLSERSSMQISLHNLKKAIPYEIWIWLDYRLRSHVVDTYIMNHEIDYLMQLFGYALTKETVHQYITVNQWLYLENLYQKSITLWSIFVFTQAKHYHDTLDLEGMKPLLRETFQRLNGVIYSSYWDRCDNQYRESRYTMADLDNESTFNELYRGICILRARHDSKIPIRFVGYLKFVTEQTKLLGLGSNSYISRDNAKVIGVHEGLIDIDYGDENDEPGDIHHLDFEDEYRPIISEFTKKLSATCLEESKKGDSKFWLDICDTLDNSETYYPHESVFGNLQFYNREYYFHPRHSEDPEDHYRFIYSAVKDNEEKVQKLQELFNRISEKKIYSWEYYDKRDIFEEIHRELLFSPHLPTWHENEYTRSREHFETIAMK